MKKLGRPQKLGLRFGALVPSLARQLKPYKIDKLDVKHFISDADAITRLYIRSLLPESQVMAARKKLLKKIHKAIKA